MNIYWTYIVAGGTVGAFIYEKLYTLWTDKKKKQLAYNRTFTAVIKLFYSYLKHKKIYSENLSLSFPVEIYATIAKHLDTFSDDLEEFKTSILKESEIIPEVAIQTYILFDTADRMRVMDRMKISSTKELDGFTDLEELAVKRAQFYSLQEIFEDFFTETIDDIRKRTSVKTEFVDRLFYFKSESYEQEAEEEQINITNKYYESLHRQGHLPTEVYNHLINKQPL